MIQRLRADQLAFDQGLAESREKARALIMAGRIGYYDNGALIPVPKPGHPYKQDTVFNLLPGQDFVSRGAFKLLTILDAFRIDVKGAVCLDAGASTGGFTDCLLGHGAAKVYAVDVGKNQLHEKLRADNRVISHEGINLRHAPPDLLPEQVDFLCGDLSFISLVHILPGCARWLKSDGLAAVLIKPQFELGREKIHKGIVRKPEDQLLAVRKITDFCEKELNLRTVGYKAAMLRGPKGNQEYMALFAFKNAPKSGILARNSHLVKLEDDMSNYRFETLQIHAGQEKPDPATGARAVPIYQTTSYVFDDTAQAADRFALRDSGNIYGRLTNTTQEALEKRVASLEGGAGALALASGAAAIDYAIQAVAGAGDHIVSQKTLYGGTHNLMAQTLPRFGIHTTFVDIHDTEAVKAAIRPETKAIYIETLGNPNSDVPDMDAIAAIAHANGMPLITDNTFGTPWLIRPIEHGADIVVHSATKFLGGHGTSLGGIIVDSGNFDWKASGRYPEISMPHPSYHGVSFVEAAGKQAFITYVRAILLRDLGACISPFNAFILLLGIETLSLRVERHTENTNKVLEYLAKHPQVEKVNHPAMPDHPDHELYTRLFPNGGGSIFTFDIKGGEEAAKKFIDNLELFSLLANVADVKSLVIHPASTTHAQLSEADLADQGINPNTIRFSIGTEHIDDILADMDKGFRACKQ